MNEVKPKAGTHKIVLFLPYFVIILLCAVILFTVQEKRQCENRLQNEISSQLYLLRSHAETVAQDGEYSDYCYDHAICAVIKSLLCQLRFLSNPEGLSDLEDVISVYDRLASRISQEGFSEAYKERYVRIKAVFDALDLPNGEDISNDRFEENLKQLQVVIDREFESFLEFRNEILGGA